MKQPRPPIPAPPALAPRPSPPPGPALEGWVPLCAPPRLPLAPTGAAGLCDAGFCDAFFLHVAGAGAGGDGSGGNAGLRVPLIRLASSARGVAARERPRLGAGFAAEHAPGAGPPCSFCCRRWLLTLPDCAPGHGVLAQ